LEVLRRSGNPFRNYFARNPDDDVCRRYHVPELYAREREQLLAVVDLYRADPTTHSEVVPVLGNKGAGKTHLLHSIKHGPKEGWQLLVTPGTYQKGTDFLEYILFQIIDTLLGGGRQRGTRPIEFIGEELTRRLLRTALAGVEASQRLELFPAPAFVRWVRKLGLGSTQADERTQWLIDTLTRPSGVPARRACSETGLDLNRAVELICAHVDRTEIHNTAGQLRRRIYQGFVRSTLLGDESDLASFLTYGFAELEYQVRPSRQDLVLALTKVLMDVFLQLKLPVVVAFDQLEDLLLVRRMDDGHRVSEAFFAGIVQVMHQVDGICFLIFAERGLWNRFVPSLDGYIQDRLNNPVHIPEYGTVKTLKLEAPPPHLVWQVVAARMKPTLEELPDAADLSAIFPFTDDQVTRIARTEPTLRDMLQQFRHLFDHLVYGATTAANAFESSEGESAVAVVSVPPTVKSVAVVDTTPVKKLFHDLPDPKQWEVQEEPGVRGQGSGIRDQESGAAKSGPRPGTGYSVLSSQYPVPSTSSSISTPLAAFWDQAIADARAKLEPEGALTGATRELQAGLGALLQLCHEHGVKVGNWRLQHVVSEFVFGSHPTYGVLTLAHWAGKDGKPWRTGVGLFLGRGPGKPKDLQIKLACFDGEPPVLDHLILLRPADDTLLTGKSKTLWDEATNAGKSARLEPLNLEELAVLYAFPRWLTAVTESLPQGAPLPNLADFLQECCDKLLQQVCLPV
jgi:hypothetical protein